MYTTARLSILIGAGLLTAAVSAGPAQAATQQPQPPREDQITVGFFRTQSDCEWVGRIGERQHRWTDSDCEQPGNTGTQRAMWRLQVDRYRDGDNNNGWPGQGGYGGNGGNGNGNGNGNHGGNGHGGNGHGGHGGGHGHGHGGGGH